MKKRHAWGHIGFGVGLIVLAVTATVFWAFTGIQSIGPRNTNVTRQTWPLFGAAVFVLVGLIKIVVGVVFLIWRKGSKPKPDPRWSTKVVNDQRDQNYRR